MNIKKLNIKKFLKTITLIVIALGLCVLGLLFLISDGAGEFRGNDIQNINCGEYIKYVDIYDVVKDAFVTDNGYTNELSKHMTEEVFKRINYKKYNKDTKYIKPLKVDFSLKEVYQTKDNVNNLVYVDMIHSIKVMDANDQIVTGSLDAGITFTVKITEYGWYIIDERQYADGRLR
ncbi:hypothetical protein [Pelorhabdus rhamnosifermentans]|uniref:hypothetical protein n=1 Tax=Pelorhabdus rhamnosifermentans TaxID=2772457 RepID=UPI001C0624FD|nr:hypothetical protein [Pelorhabdus rhamnosifermentans]